VDRVLLIRLGALGDVVHAIPVAAALRRAYPSVQIDWLVSAKHREIVDLVTVVDRRLVISDRSDASGGMPLLRAVVELRRGRYDVVIDLQGLLKSAVLARSTGAPRVLGFSSRYLRERMARPFYTEVYDPGGAGMYDRAETAHVARINLGLLELLGLKTTALEFPIAETDSPVAREIRQRAGGRYVVLNPGAAWPNKRWPAERLGAAAQGLYAQHHLRSIVVWGPSEEPLARDVVSASGGAAWSTPATSIADLVALLRGASLMVSGDTGPAHIAAALGTPIVGLFGPTRPSRNGPWAADDITVSRDAVCQCHHLRRCRLETMCLLDIQVDEVLGAVERRLAVEPNRV
jgi:heptosyltransferase-1